jgi:hypothetical protein
MLKRIPRSRTRAMTDFQRQWTDRKIATIANLGLLGYTSHEIATALGDHTMPETVRSLLSRWGVYDRAAGDGRKRIAVRIHQRACNKATQMAKQAGVPLELYLGRALEFAIRDDLVDSLSDGELEAYV